MASKSYSLDSMVEVSFKNLTKPVSSKSFHKIVFVIDEAEAGTKWKPTDRKKDYNNFDDFYAAVCVKWEECFYRTSGSSALVEISNKENIHSLSRVYSVGLFGVLSLLSYLNLNFFIGVIHVLYIGMVIVSKQISTLKKEHIQSFIFYYNWS
jgi:hypothetical protein